MDPQAGGAIPAMWVPCVVFAHLFAFSFLISMVRVSNPAAWETGKRRLGRLVGRGRRSGDGTAPTAAAIAAATAAGGPGAKATAAGAGKDTKAQDQNSHAAGGQADRSNPSNRDVELGTVHEGSHVVEAPPSTSSHSSAELIDKLAPLMKPMLLEWQEIGCTYHTGKEQRVVLLNVWGRAEPGDMLALMGPSGAGKSTLMDILAGRKSVGDLKGVVLVNKQRRRKEHFRKVTAYVPQEDNFLPTMTVGETLYFYATLQLPDSQTKAQRQERIAEVLAAMGLSHTSETLVGGTLPGGIILRGLSGGERKRLSIAQGIMSTPCIVFLDEPTSGLDSAAALNVMGYLRGMASKFSQTVISSIHQPRAAIWQLFDKVVLLSGGLMMYSGDREGMVPWFVDGCGYPYDPAMHGIASDWVMDLVNVGFRKPEALFGKMMNTVEELDAAADAFFEKYMADNGISSSSSTVAEAASPAKQQVVVAEAVIAGGSTGAAADAGHGPQDQAVGDLEVGHVASVASSPSKPDRRSWFGGSAEGGSGSSDVQQSAGWFKQCGVLLWRELLSVTRNPADVAGRCLIFTWLAVFLGLIYYNMPPTVDALRSRLNVLFLEPVILLLMPYVYMSLFTSDKQYFIQDVSSKLYKPSAYYVAKQLAVLPFAVLNSLLFAYTLYGMAGLRHSPQSVGINGLMSVLIYLIAAQVLTFTAVVAPNQDMAFMLAIVWTACQLLLSNFMVRYSEMKQVWFSYIRYISAMGYAFDGYAQAEFQGVVYSCTGGLAPSITSFLPMFLPNTPIVGRFMGQAGAATGSQAAACSIALDSILGYFSLYRPLWMTCVILVGYLGVLHVLTFGGQLMLTRKERR